MAALPSSFLNPGTSSDVSLNATTSVAQLRADVYIGQNAALAVTICGGPAAFVTASDALFAGGTVDCEQPAKSSTATVIALTAHCLNTALIEILHVAVFVVLQ